MKRIAALLLALLMLLPAAAGAEKSRVLDLALSMLEEGNPFLVRYNAENGTEIAARFPLGCPYFWGGRSVKNILKPASPGQNSDYYKMDQKYLYGLDCAGFTRWVGIHMGYTEHDSISRLLSYKTHPDIGIYKALKATGEKRAQALRIGDLLAIRHTSGGFHIAIYIGTLRSFGYDEKSVPEELAPYLSYPLLIHCTGSIEYQERYRAYLEETGQEDLIPPFGGVIVTILDVPPEAAPMKTADGDGVEIPCFELEGYHLQVTDLTAERTYRFVRWKKRPEKKEEQTGQQTEPQTNQP